MESATGTTERIRFGDGTILAYAYDPACWRIDDQGNPTLVLLLTDDPTMPFALGFLEDSDCPPGTQSDPRAARRASDGRHAPVGAVSRGAVRGRRHR